MNQLISDINIDIEFRKRLFNSKFRNENFKKIIQSLNKLNIDSTSFDPKIRLERIIEDKDYESVGSEEYKNIMNFKHYELNCGVEDRKVFGKEFKRWKKMEEDEYQNKK